jgi:hypothetical protein
MITMLVPLTLALLPLVVSTVKLNVTITMLVPRTLAMKSEVVFLLISALLVKPPTNVILIIAIL